MRQDRLSDVEALAWFDWYRRRERRLRAVRIIRFSIGAAWFFFVHSAAAVVFFLWVTVASLATRGRSTERLASARYWFQVTLHLLFLSTATVVITVIMFWRPSAG